jgi:hypothetical protein
MILARRGLRATRPEGAIDVDDVVTVGERVVAEGRFEPPRDGSEPGEKRRVGAVLDLRDGRVSRWKPFQSPEEALAAARGAPVGRT